MAEDERRARRRWRPLAGWAVEVLVWTLLSWGIWLLSLSAVDDEDLFVGGLCALGSGLAAAAVRRVWAVRWRPTLGSVLPALLLPVSVVVDTLVVLSAPWRRPDVRIEEVDIGARGDASAAAARRALATLVTTSTPASVVLDADPETGVLVVHTLASPAPDLYRRYARR